MMKNKFGFRSNISLTVLPPERQSIVPPCELSVRDVIRYGFPTSIFSKEVREWKLRNLPNLWRGFKREIAARIAHIGFYSGHVCLMVVSPDGTCEDYGLVSMRVITTVAAEQVVGALRGLNSINTFRYHAVGSGSSAESASDTALISEHSSLYSTPNTRPTGSQVTGSSARIYRSIASITLTSTVSIAEWGMFSQASTSGGNLFDRALITPQTIVVGRTIQSDYRLTVVSGT